MASLLDAQHKRNNADKNPASSIVVSFGKTINWIPLPLGGRQVVGQSSKIHANSRAHTSEQMQIQTIGC